MGHEKQKPSLVVQNGWILRHSFVFFLFCFVLFFLRLACGRLCSASAHQTIPKASMALEIYCCDFDFFAVVCFLCFIDVSVSVVFFCLWLMRKVVFYQNAHQTILSSFIPKRGSGIDIFFLLLLVSIRSECQRDGT